MNHDDFVRSFAQDVRLGLSASPQKFLPCQYLYDDLGSALFDAVCVLPEYGLSRAGQRLLALHGADLGEHVRMPLRIIELGSGSGQKTQTLLKTLVAQHAPGDVHYWPVDISEAAVQLCARQAEKIRGLQVTALQCDYLTGLQKGLADRQPNEQVLVLFLGSTIGNFDPADAHQFLCDVRATLAPGDLLFLATDLEKPKEVLEKAYDDALGVTAAFNRNILMHINRVLAANFDLNDFAHVARYNPKHARIEMHLQALHPIRVRVAAADVEVTLKAQETIWTESSHKFSQARLATLAQSAQFTPVVQWMDEEWCFAHNLWRA